MPRPFLKKTSGRSRSSVVSNIVLPRGTKIPNHIAIIPDGNRRWARARGHHTFFGHKKGFERAVELARAARSMGVHTVTLWGFSSENWDRTKEEIDYLMKLYVKLVDDYLVEAEKEKVKLVHIGRKDRLPKFLLDKIADAEAKTANYDKYIANLAIDYGGHDDILRAIKGIVADGISEDKIDKKLVESYLDTKNQPYPYVDLLIRTSGEQRTSGLLLWQMEYAEMYWEESHFPDFTPEKLSHAILDYSRRRRRFGGNDKESHLKFRPEIAAKIELDWWRLRNIPAGTKFSDYAIAHIKEQFGLSSKLASQAAKLLVSAFVEGDRDKWEKAGASMKKFYKLVSEELSLAFEPNLVASLDIKLLQKARNVSYSNTAELEDATREYLAEFYRISTFQANKAAHLRVLASLERKRAEDGEGDVHWDRARDYLEKYYLALKDRVA